MLKRVKNSTHINFGCEAFRSLFQSSRVPGWVPGFQGSKDPPCPPPHEHSPFQGSSVHILRVPRFQGSRVPGFQGFRVPRFQGSRVPGFQGFRVPGFQGSTVPGFQGSRFQCSRVPGFQGSRVSGFQGSRAPVPDFGLRSRRRHHSQTQRLKPNSHTAVGNYMSILAKGVQRFGGKPKEQDVAHRRPKCV